MEDYMEIDQVFGESPFRYLPCEILRLILGYLDNDLVNAGRVCTLWCTIAYNELFERGLWSMEVLQDHFKAVDDFTKAIKVNPVQSATYLKRGIAHYKEGEEAEALRDIDRALTKNP